MFKNQSDAPCWDVPETLCSHDLVDAKLFKKMGLNKCLSCVYYKQFNKNVNQLI